MTIEPMTVKDGDREIKVKPLSALERMRIFKFLPKGCDERPLYISMVFLAASVRTIGGAPMPFPGDEKGVEFIIGHLGDSGVDAVQVALTPPDVEPELPVEIAAGNLPDALNSRAGPT